MQGDHLKGTVAHTEAEKKSGVPFPSQILWGNHQKELQEQLVETAHLTTL